MRDSEIRFPMFDPSFLYDIVILAAETMGVKDNPMGGRISFA